MISTPTYEIDGNRQLIARVGDEAHSLGVFPPGDRLAWFKLFTRMFLLGARTANRELAAALEADEAMPL
jgi:hypothetical protein